MRFRFPIRGAKDAPVVDETNPPQDAETAVGDTKEKVAVDNQAHDSEGEESLSDYEHGVAAIRALAQVWTMKHLIVAYLL